MSDYSELKRLAEAFPADLDWDSNTEPFFNGPSGESLGGGATGFYTVYGKPFRLEGEDYDYDGPTYVESCNVEFAKFMVSAREGVLSLIAENEKLLAREAEHVRQFNDLSDFRRRTVEGFDSKIAALEAEIEALREDLEQARREPLYSTRLAAERYRWLREQHWNDSPMAVVFNPKVTVKLGAVCPSGLQLDQAIDEERLKAKADD